MNALGVVSYFRPDDPRSYGLRVVNVWLSFVIIAGNRSCVVDLYAIRLLGNIVSNVLRIEKSFIGNIIDTRL